MTNLVQKTSSLLAQLWIASVCFFCSQNVMSDDFFLDGFEVFGIKESSFSQMQIIPTRAMDNETLFLAVAAEKDSSMSMSQRLLNNRWLLDDKNQSYSGAEALRRYLRLYFIQQWKNDQQIKKGNTTLFLPITKIDKKSPFMDISNYNLRVSDDKVRLKFKYEFD